MELRAEAVRLRCGPRGRLIHRGADPQGGYDDWIYAVERTVLSVLLGFGVMMSLRNRITFRKKSKSRRTRVDYNHQSVVCIALSSSVLSETA